METPENQQVMNNKSVYAQYLTPEVGTPILTYEGVCTHSIIVQLGQELEQILAHKAGARGKRVFGAFIEMIQNIKNYSTEIVQTEDEAANGAGIIRVSEEDLCFTITAGNFMRRKDCARVEAKCLAAKGVPVGELRAYYNEQIKREREETSKGAGVGFIDIAIKTGGNWDFSFQNSKERDAAGEPLVFFVVNAYVAKREEASNGSPSHARR